MNRKNISDEFSPYTTAGSLSPSSLIPVDFGVCVHVRNLTHTHTHHWNMRNEILKQQDSWIFSQSLLWGNTSNPPPFFYLFLSVCLYLHDQKNSDEIMMGNKKGWCLLASFMQKKISWIKWGTHTHTKHILLQSAPIRLLHRLATLNRHDMYCKLYCSKLKYDPRVHVDCRSVWGCIFHCYTSVVSCATAKGVVKATVVMTAVNIRAVYHAIKTIRMTVTHMERVSDGERERKKSRQKSRTMWCT